MRTRRFSLAVLAVVMMTTMTGISFGDDRDDRNEIEFRGVVEALPAGGLLGDWMVGGRTVHVTSLTRIEQRHGVVALGVLVEVEGSLRADGSVDAKKVEVEDDLVARVEFSGTVERLPDAGLVGDWMVSGRTVHVSLLTRIEQRGGTIAVGAVVEVEGMQRPDGSVDATKIEVERGLEEGVEIEFKGFVEALPAGGIIGDWTVSGRTVHVSESTRIKQERGIVQLGSFVDVEGTQRADGSVDARKVEVEAAPGADARIKFRGFIETLPSGLVGDWTVGGRTVHVRATTRIKQGKGVVAVGALVEVKGLLLPDGSVEATMIKVKREEG